jgi:hypothetical protein
MSTGIRFGKPVQKQRSARRTNALKFKAKFLSVLDLLTISHNGLKAKNPSAAGTIELKIVRGYFAVGSIFIIASGSKS